MNKDCTYYDANKFAIITQQKQNVNDQYSRRHLYALRLAAYFGLLHRFLSVPIFSTVFNGYQFRSIAYRLYAYSALMQEFFWSEHALLCVYSLRLTASQHLIIRNKNKKTDKDC